MRKRWGFLGAALLVAALCPSIASASHPSMICLDIGEDERFPTNNDDMIERLVAFPGATDADHPPQHEGCVTGQVEAGQDWRGTVVDFEITGAGDPDSSDSPSSPDATCTVPPDSDHCAADAFPAQGEQFIRAWIDFDTSVEADRTEGPDEDSTPGAHGEPDATDVSRWTWTHGDPPPHPCGSDDVCWGHVSIGYEGRDNQFFGRIRRENDSCGTGAVTLRKKRPGRDRRVAEALVSGPYWEVVLERRVSGRFYAALSSSTTQPVDTDWPKYPCAGDRSRILTID